MKFLLYSSARDNKVGQTVPYLEFFSQFGEVILVHALNDLEFFSEFADVLIVPGGPDVNMATYGETPHFRNGGPDPHYEFLDKYLLKNLWLDKNRPVIGICRGMQVINCLLGGNLHQHIEGHRQEIHRSLPFHDLYFDGGKIKVNSLHHQAVNKLGEGLVPIAWSRAQKDCPSIPNIKFFKKEKDTSYYSFVEAFEGENVLAFQYHPEEMNCSFAIEKIKKFLS